MRVLQVLEKGFSKMELNSRVKYVETLQILRRNPKLRENERQKIIEFLNSEKSKSEGREAESRFEH